MPAFIFRFRSKETYNCLQTFPTIINLLVPKLKEISRRYRLNQVFYQSLNSRDLISNSVRGIEFSMDYQPAMSEAGRNSFISCCLFDSRISPSLWMFCNVAPEHAEQLFMIYGFWIRNKYYGRSGTEAPMYQEIL